MRNRILIGGASLSGKTSLAAKLSEELGWEVVATDYLARHPGRPWRVDGSEVPWHVVDHFLSLSPAELLADVLRHYRSLTHRIRDLVTGDRKGIIVEGSAVLPEFAFELQSEAQCCFLIAKQGVLTNRIIHQAGAGNDAAMKFAARAELMNGFIADEAIRLGLPTFDSDSVSTDAILS